MFSFILPRVALSALVVLLAAPPSPRIPLVEGLTVVTAVIDPEVGDYESLHRVETVSADGGISVVVSGDVPNPFDHKIQHVKVTRAVRGEDLKSARIYKYNFSTDDDLTFAGTTATGASAVIITELRAKGAATMAVNGERPGIGGLMSAALGAMTSGDASGGLSLGPNAPARRPDHVMAGLPRSAGAVEGVRVGSNTLPGLHGGDRRHVVIAQCEVEDVDVLGDAGRCHRLGDHDVAELQMPADHDLSGRTRVCLRRRDDHWILEHEALRERAPRLGDDALLLVLVA